MGATDLLALSVCAVAAVTDTRERRVPNWLTLGGFVVALGLHLARSVESGDYLGGVGIPLACAAGALLVFGALAVLGMLGLGDAKLAAVLGACVGWPQIGILTLYTLLAGGALAVVTALARGQLKAVFGNIARGRVGVGAEGLDAPHLHRMPYAAAFLIGTSWQLAALRWPVLSLL